MFIALVLIVIAVLLGITLLAGFMGGILGGCGSIPGGQLCLAEGLGDRHLEATAGGGLDPPAFSGGRVVSLRHINRLEHRNLLI